MRVTVEEEREAPRGWVFRVRVEGAGGAGKAGSVREVRLSWVDHEYWSRGQCPPAEVVSALVGLLAERGGLDELGGSFDASVARRRQPWLDDELRARL